MGRRLTGFDYSRPLFYMVTVTCHAERQALSEIVAPGKCQMNAITRAMVNCIRNFHLGCKAIAPIECFSIMPDHIHLLIRISEQVGAKLLSGENQRPFADGASAAGSGDLKSFAPFIRSALRRLSVCSCRHWKGVMPR